MASRDGGGGGGGGSRLPDNRCEMYALWWGKDIGYQRGMRYLCRVSSGWGDSVCVRGDGGGGIIR